jgi:hypothetical protein
MSVLHLFIAILAVLSVSIVLAIINWIVQARISSRILYLEKEIEKKTLEFLALKKERSAGFVQPSAAPASESEPAPAIEMPIQQQTVNEGAIQIVRNVRGTFSPAGPPMQMGNSDIPPEEPIEATRIDDGAGIPIDRSAASTPLTGSPYPDDTRRWMPVAGQAAPVLQPAPSVRSPVHGAWPGQAGVVIPVYSPAAQGPDLNQLYNDLVAALKTQPDTAISFDFANIQAMNAGEIEYLEKIHWSLASQNRTLTFVNCSPSLALAMKQHPQLGELFR